MKNIKKYKTLIWGVIIAGLFIAGDIFFLANHELVIRSPIIIRQPLIRIQDEKTIREEAIKRAVDRVIEEMELNKEANKEKEAVVRPANKVLAVESTTTADIKQSVLKWGARYNVDTDLIICVIMNESSGLVDPCNEVNDCDNGKAVGICQFHKPTWEMFRREMGLSTVDERANPDKAIRTMVWAFKNGYGNHWTPILDRRCQ